MITKETTGLISPHVCAYPIPEPGYWSSYVVYFCVMFDALKGDVIVRFVD